MIKYFLSCLTYYTLHPTRLFRRNATISALQRSVSSALACLQRSVPSAIAFSSSRRRDHSRASVLIFALLFTLFALLPTLSFAQAPFEQELMFSTLRKVKEQEMQAWVEGILWAQNHRDSISEFDSRFVKIAIKVHISNHTIDATVQTQFQSLIDGLTQITLDFDDTLTIDSVFGNASSYTLIGETLTIFLDQAYNNGETFTIATTYHGHPRVVGGLKGFRFESHQGIPVVATLCTPFLAHTWWPCVDGPADKLDSVHLRITIPDTSYAGFPLYAASNGKLMSITYPQQGWVTYEWHENYPIVPYYVSIAISNYHIYSHFYHFDADSMEVPYYVFPEHYEQSQTTFAETVDMIEFFASLFGEYPFVNEKYSMAEIGFYGAIEKQTKTIMGGVSSSWYMVVCHELSHMWFADMISPTSWHHCWVNEGFATYCEALWQENKYGIEEYHDYMDDLKYWQGGTIYLYDISDPFGIFMQICYDKGAWVLHMLRHVFGDSTFFDVMHTYATDPRFMYKNASTEDFQEICETVSGMDLSEFFDQWIYDEYYPRYEYWWYVEPQKDRYQVHVGIRQTQQSSGWRSVFVMPIDLVFSLSGGGDTTVVVQNNDTLQTYQFEFNDAPTALSFDPDEWILRYVVENIEETETPPLNTQNLSIQCSPNPVNGVAFIEYALPHASEITISLFNITGQRIEIIDQGYKNAGVHQIQWSTKNIANGIYFIGINGVITQKIIKVK
jgi:aminopeptidase N